METVKKNSCQWGHNCTCDDCEVCKDYCNCSLPDEITERDDREDFMRQWWQIVREDG